MKVLAGQSLFDAAIQHCGTAEAAFDLAFAKGISLTDELFVGEELPEIGIINRDNFDYYSRRNLKPATGLTDWQFSEVLGEGIDFMGIEIDFIVSE